MKQEISLIRRGLKDYSLIIYLTKDTREFKGAVPDIKYFNNLNSRNPADLLKYNQLIKRIETENNGIWYCRQELEKYLINDVEILYDIMMKTAKYYYENYSINISRIRTISGLDF
uniref:DNA-directed DNA polymerase n=1 Tax=Armillaria solidipes TaxID=1076256 RepID=A0A4D6FHE9_9AGAR|nr:DNA polymerase [Armillaria solidipes]QCB16452.1 DNA polymerase [Armillaria solidipes]